MARLRNGFEATKRLVWVVHGDSQLLEMARTQILDREAEIMSTRRGNALIRAVLPEYRPAPPKNMGKQSTEEDMRMCESIG